jgi:hypothetical protein
LSPGERASLHIHHLREPCRLQFLAGLLRPSADLVIPIETPPVGIVGLNGAMGGGGGLGAAGGMRGGGG